jgi:tRNA (guanine-N7-)-methyltransferase
MDWSTHYPFFAEPESLGLEEMDTCLDKKPRKMRKQITIADIGCGFGGLLVALAPKFPNDLILGLEIRTQVLDYVNDRITALRIQHLPQSSISPGHFAPASDSPPYSNISALRANTMKFLPNFFSRSQLKYLFICFPDPHFKNRKKKARIVSKTLCAEYAFVVRPGGLVYTITDVEELGEWMDTAFRESGGLWEKVDVDGYVNEPVETDEQNKTMVEAGDAKAEDIKAINPEDEEGAIRACVHSMMHETEEGMKVSRVGGKKFVGVWRRVEDPPWPC